MANEEHPNECPDCIHLGVGEYILSHHRLKLSSRQDLRRIMSKLNGEISE